MHRSGGFSESVNLPFGDCVKIETGSYYRLYLLTHSYLEDLGPGKELKLKEIGSGTKASFEIVWVYSGGSELNPEGYCSNRECS